MAGGEDHARQAGVGPAAQWVVLAFLALAAGALGGRLLFGSDSAAGQVGLSQPRTGPAGAADGVFAVAGQITRDSYGLYLVDVPRGTICVYQYLGGQQGLRLVAARTFIYDRQLDSYNTYPLPKDVAKMVAEARRLKDVKTKP
jgi:hypothetical protein